MIANNPQLVLNNQILLTMIDYNIPFATNEEISKLIYDFYSFWELSQPEAGAEKIELQAKADLIRDYYIQLWDNIKLSDLYNPLENYNMIEDEQVKSDNDESVKNTGSEYPMNGNKRPVNTDESSGKRLYNSARSLTRHGNIGVMSSQQMQKQSRDLIVNIKKMYISEFKNCFMLCL